MGKLKNSVFYDMLKFATNCTGRTLSSDREREQKGEKDSREKNARANKDQWPKNFLSLYFMTIFWFLNCGVPDFIHMCCRCDFLPKVWIAREYLALKVSCWSELCSTVIESCPLVRSWSKKLWRRDFISRVIHHYNLSTPPLNSKTRKISHTYIHLSIIFLVFRDSYLVKKKWWMDVLIFSSLI